MAKVDFTSFKDDIKVKEKTSRGLMKEAFDKHTEEILDIASESMEKEFKKKFEKGKGRQITVTVYCNSCTEVFTIKGKNNKSDDTPQQICTHLILKNWEVDLGSK